MSADTTTTEAPLDLPTPDGGEEPVPGEEIDENDGVVEVSSTLAEDTAGGTVTGNLDEN